MSKGYVTMPDYETLIDPSVEQLATAWQKVAGYQYDADTMERTHKAMSSWPVFRVETNPDDKGYIIRIYSHWVSGILHVNVEKTNI